MVVYRQILKPLNSAKQKPIFICFIMCYCSFVILIIIAVLSTSFYSLTVIKFVTLCNDNVESDRIDFKRAAEFEVIS